MRPRWYRDRRWLGLRRVGSRSRLGEVGDKVVKGLAVSDLGVELRLRVPGLRGEVGGGEGKVKLVDLLFHVESLGRGEQPVVQGEEVHQVDEEAERMGPERVRTRVVDVVVDL